MDVRELGITKFELKNGEENLLFGKYTDFNLLEGVAVPYKIELRNEKEKQTFIINYKSMEANKKDIYIDFKIPEDATIIKW